MSAPADDLVRRLREDAKETIVPWGTAQIERKAADRIEALQADVLAAEARAATLRAEQAAWRMDAQGEHLRAENIVIAVRALIDAADEMYRISERKHDAWIAYAAARAVLKEPTK